MPGSALRWLPHAGIALLGVGLVAILLATSTEPAWSAVVPPVAGALSGMLARQTSCPRPLATGITVGAATGVLIIIAAVVVLLWTMNSVPDAFFEEGR